MGLGPVRRFAERHRRLLNLLLHANAGLLEGPLAPLLRAPRLIDFDVKRAWFRGRVRAQQVPLPSTLCLLPPLSLRRDAFRAPRPR